MMLANKLNSRLACHRAGSVRSEPVHRDRADDDEGVQAAVHANSVSGSVRCLCDRSDEHDGRGVCCALHSGFLLRIGMFS